MSTSASGEIDVVADGEHRYAAVLTTSAGTRTEHVVTSDPDLLAKLSVTDAEEPFLVRRVLELLLDAAEAAEAAEGTGNAGGDDQGVAAPAVPSVIDLRTLDAERPDLLATVPLR